MIAPATGLRRQANPRDVPPSVLCVRLPERPSGAAPRVIAALADQGIETRQWYCPPLHRQAAFADPTDGAALPVTDALGECLLGLPFHHFLDDAAIDGIVDTLRAALVGPG